MFKSVNSGIISLLYHFLLFSFTLIPQNILLQTLLSKAATCLAIFLFNIKDSALYVAIGLIKVSQIFPFSAMSTD